MVASPAWVVSLDDLRQSAPFDRLDSSVLEECQALWERRRYRMGQLILHGETLPDGVLLLRQGRVRSVGARLVGSGWRTLEHLASGDLVGWVGLCRGKPCEHLRASTEVEAWWLPASAFLALVDRSPELKQWCEGQFGAAELYQLVVELVRHEPAHATLLDHWPQTWREAALAQADAASDLPADRLWLASAPGRWLGVRAFEQAPASLEPPSGPEALAPSDGEAGGSYALSPEPPASRAEGMGAGLTLARASGVRDAPLAIAQALARYYGVPFNRDGMEDQVEGILQRQSRLNLVNYGQLVSNLGLRAVLTEVPADRLRRLPTPAVLAQHDQIGVLDGIDPDGCARVLDPELGPLRIPVAELADAEGNVAVLLMERQVDSKEARFSWGWFVPFLRPHKRALLEVLVASFVLNLLALATPLGLQVLIDQVAQYRNTGALISISALLLLAGLVKSVVRTLRSLIFTEVSNRVDQVTRATILDQMVRLPQGFFDSRPVGQVTYYFGQLDRLREFLIGQSLTTGVDFVFSLLYIFILLLINPVLTLVTLSTVPLFIILALVSNPVVERLIERSIGEAIRTFSFLNEAITGIQTIKAQNAELKTRWEFQNRYTRFIGEDFKLRITQETISGLANFISELNQLLVIGVGIWFVMQGQLTLGAFFAFRIISGYITGPLVQIVQTYQQFKLNSEAIKLVGDIVDRTTEQTEAEATNIPMPPLRGAVECKGVYFRFSPGAPQVLQNIDLSVPEGAFVGMVGGSGSGKSTLLKLLPRFYRPEKGTVLIDGFDINKVELYSLRRQIGVVPQDSLLFDGTIKENLQMVKPDATADELIRAARIACAHDFIMAMPQGYNSSVGERGAGLSGGQRQRLALARAVLQNPRMLILDEATSALDARTERQVCLNLFEAFRGRTVFFITHRLTTVRPADMIVLMDQGSIMEVGSHGELMARQGWYYGLYQSQMQEGLG